MTLEEHFEHVGRLVLAAKNLVLYVDEVDMLCSPSALKAKNSSYWSRPENQQRMPVLEEILNRGRHSGIAGIFISRVPAQVHGLIRSQASEMRIFRSTEGNVLSYFRQRDEALAQLLPTLGDFEYALWQDGKTPVRAGGRR
ncbi:MAG: ATP-binding protein [Acidobacteria bacterium]|nr:ATP-binding protein [Acidobacteriota bacterium]